MKKRILFVCRCNSSRSQMAEALARIWAHGAVHAYSAGVAPAREVSARAIEAMRDIGYELRDHRPTPVAAYSGDRFNVVVLISCDTDRALHADRLEFWHDIPDPTNGGLDVFRVVRDLLAERVLRLLGPAATITRDRNSVKAALLANQAKPVPLRVAASLAHHQLHGGLPPNMGQALNDTAVSLGQVADVYFLTAARRLRRLAQEDIGGGRFEDGGAAFRCADGRLFTSLSMRRSEILDAIGALKTAQEALQTAKSESREIR
jgi:arsenate reductase (thioredoxin)